MCLIALAVDVPGPWLLALAANRDEFHDRPATPAGWWGDAMPGVLAGRDLEAGGTWLGLRRTPGDESLRIAALTNLRPGLMPAAAPSLPEDGLRPSRGRLVAGFLASPADPAAFLEQLEPPAARYAGFNLLAVEVHDRSGSVNACYLNNLPASRPRRLQAGLHVLSNATLDIEWPKTRRLRGAMTRALQASSGNDVGRGDDVGRGEDVGRGDDGGKGGDDIAVRLGGALLDALADRTQATDADLPHTGLDRRRERLLSAPFIVDGEYGTRCSTVLLISRAGDVFFGERSFGPDGKPVGEVVERFRRDGQTANRD